MPDQPPSDRRLLDRAPLRALAPRLQRALGAARALASDSLHQRFRVLVLVREAYDKLFEEEDALRQIRADLVVLLRLVHAWATRRYTAVPWKTLLYAVGAITYFVVPVDVIPDFIPAVGLMDDIAVVAAVVRALHRDLEAFRTWEQEQQAQQRRAQQKPPSRLRRLMRET